MNDGDDQPNRLYSFVSLVTTNDFILGLHTLLYSLVKTNSQVPRCHVLHTSQVEVHRLEELRTLYSHRRFEVTYQLVEDIASPQNAHVQSWNTTGYTKLHVFNLIQYSKLVFIDADAIVLQNIDELFDLPYKFAAAPDVFPPDRFNAGVMVLTPDAVRYKHMISKCDQIYSYDGGDTGFLNGYFKDWFTSSTEGRLPFGYNAQRTMYWMVNEKNPGYWNAISPLKIIHYASSPKPWLETKRKGDLEMLWWQYYIESKTLVLS